MSDYDLILSKDEIKSSDAQANETNRMRDALDLFRTLINWKKKTYSHGARKKNKNFAQNNSMIKQNETLLFENISIILFLNKTDLFEEKIKHSSLRKCFSDLPIDCAKTISAEEAKEFIAHKFLQCQESFQPRREIYWHYTFALDRENIDTVIASVQDRIIKHSLESMRF